MLTFRIDRRWIAPALFVLTLLVCLAWAGAAMAADEPLSTPTQQLLPSVQVWVFLVAALTPLVTYVLNYLGPQISETIKGAVLVAASAITGALTQLIVTGTFKLDVATLENVLLAVFTAFAAHGILWKPTAISTKLGGGRNKQTGS